MKKLVREEDISIQITNYKHHKTLYVDDIDLAKNTFTVKGHRCKTLGELEFFWSFTAVRKDVPELIEPPRQQVQESIQKPQSNGSVSREEIKEVIREEFEDMVRDILDEYMEKSLVTEDIHIKIGDTIFGGSLKPLPKKKKRR